jgi:alcohol dehydrogenase class IV
VSEQKTGPLRHIYDKAEQFLAKEGIEFEHFDGVIANPTVKIVSDGAKVAKAFRPDVILGIGGGSSLDSAKAIAVEGDSRKDPAGTISSSRTNRPIELFR